uniref:Uncharacterized protein n=3 Tax=Palpitomonas bilix TaxID=652834 RepID=A0A7S3FXN0_9EUKA|mmetsp:Transcript_11318/g.29901  ORF Transcript_11318/g.29901 Transcript_11318/m.29901 type:complete len:344 (+) Transcript_11318:1611-2642(+)|eukprot:CAMPEP_0113884428 /NCGR_PEP_ID=MMETSP0780_2-20120614/10260_1 /TAXON_ID=652834 /ORGANISM="Palpitomonas bilix" /LENGTH=343 /DNA_ID=CAMNT_0000872063 /DNA_START=136 /DNA_END=1167 /DNA_ORIENTATION=+ /assembly_acc=CAM_ASM_000599
MNEGDHGGVDGENTASQRSPPTRRMSNASRAPSVSGARESRANSIDSTKHGLKSEVGGLVQPRFSLQQAKEFALGALNEKASRSNRFQEFFASPKCDSLLTNCVGYFNALLQRAIELHDQKIKQQVQKGMGQPEQTGGGPTLLLVDGPRDVPQASEERLKAIASDYAHIILKHSDHTKAQQDNLFFETMYEFINRVLAYAFDRRYLHDIEIELGRIFRSSFFNLSKRVRVDNKKKEPMKFRELYKQRHEKDPLAQRTANANTQPIQRESVYSVVHTRSPLIDSVVPDSGRKTLKQLHQVGKETQKASEMKSSRTAREQHPARGEVDADLRPHRIENLAALRTA